MDIMSGSAWASLCRLCEVNGLADPCLKKDGDDIELWVTTGYLADGTPVLTLVAHGADIHSITRRVQQLCWAWGRK